MPMATTCTIGVIVVVVHFLNAKNVFLRSHTVEPRGFFYFVNNHAFYIYAHYCMTQLQCEKLIELCMQCTQCTQRVGGETIGETSILLSSTHETSEMSIKLRHSTQLNAHIAHKLCELLTSSMLHCQLGGGRKRR